MCRTGRFSREVDLVAPEHRVDPPAQAGFLGKLSEELNGLGGNSVLRIIEVNTRRFGSDALAALAVIGEQISQMQRAHASTMRLQFLPGRPLRQQLVREWLR